MLIIFVRSYVVLGSNKYVRKNGHVKKTRSKICSFRKTTHEILELIERIISCQKLKTNVFYSNYVFLHAPFLLNILALIDSFFECKLTWNTFWNP